ncbi:unnamed protein product [Penicillium camemberti]|uniref:Str. FM013 n=1 Tax=Penicillium camemberti (strain FM 013) TaxID=1429867 RepID=A0A0G4NU18_PENC3|nr:unnamed protein product [Penicillium camemberti]
MLQLSSPDSLPTREILRVRLTLGQKKKKRTSSAKVFALCMKIPTSATCEFKKHQRLRGTVSISHLPDVL